MAEKLYCTSCKTIKNLMPGPYARVNGSNYYQCRSCNTSRHKKYRKTKSGGESTRKAAAKQRRHAPEKYKARNALNEAIRAGKLNRPAFCPKCQSAETIHAHHDDYAKPLDVVWLCRSCHIAHHRTMSRTMI